MFISLPDPEATFMTLHDASKEFELDCKVRHLSPKTIDNYTKQLRYLENHLSIEFSILNIKDVKPAHIKSFMAMMDDAGRKSQYINDLLKVFKTFFTYLEAEGYPKAGIRDNSCYTEKNVIPSNASKACSNKASLDKYSV